MAAVTICSDFISSIAGVLLGRLGIKEHELGECFQQHMKGILLALSSWACLGFPGGTDGKVSACSAGNPGSIPGLGRSLGEGNGNPLQYSCLENSMD